MRSEHKSTEDEYDAFDSRWRRLLNWNPGQRKRLKQKSHRQDRRAARKDTQRSREQKGW